MDKIKKIYRFINFIIDNMKKTEISDLANNLTYVSLLSFFPLIALMIGISNGFGLDIRLLNKIKIYLPDNVDQLEYLYNTADRLIKSLNSNFLSGIGLLIILWSIFKVFMILEKSFNKIWNVKEEREFSRNLINYTALTFMLPIFIVILVATNDTMINLFNSYGQIGITTIVLMKLLKIFIYLMILTVLYYIVPNTKVKLKPAFIASVFVLIFLYIFSISYTLIQGYITNYNKIYGSLALVPLFLIWIRYFWTLILIGAKLSNLIATNKEDDNITLSLKNEKELAVLILYIFIEKFENKDGKVSLENLYETLKIDKGIIKYVLDVLENFSYIIYKEDENSYYLIKNPETIYFDEFINLIENKENEILDINIDDKTFYKIKEMLAYQKDKKIKNI